MKIKPRGTKSHRFILVDTKTEEMPRSNYVRPGDTGNARESGQKSQERPRKPNKPKGSVNVQSQTKEKSKTQHTPNGAGQKKANTSSGTKAESTTPRKKHLTRHETKKVLDKIFACDIHDLEEEEQQEVNFIFHKFKQRKCSNFCPAKVNTKCRCGLPKECHDIEKPKHGIEWTPQNDTEAIQIVDFGKLKHSHTEISGRYVRVDDFMEDMDVVFDLVTKHWKFPEPQLVISICGGNQTVQTKNIFKLFDSGKEIKDTWIITDGMCTKNSQSCTHSSAETIEKVKHLENKLHLLGISTWGVLAGADKLHEPHIGDNIASYSPTPSKYEGVDYFLEENHTHFLLCDNGTHGKKKTEPTLQRKLEKYIRHKRHPNEKEFSAVVVVVSCGDESTIDKVAWAVENNICVIIVEGSGDVANMLATMVRKMKDHDDKPEDKRLDDLIKKYKDPYLRDDSDEEKLKELMKKRNMVKSWKPEDGKDFTKMAISFCHEFRMEQLFIEIEGLSEQIRKTGYRGNTNVVPPDLVEHLRERCDKRTTLRDTVHLMRRLYKNLMEGDDGVSKVVKNLTGIRGHSELYVNGKSELTDKDTMLPYVGKVIFKLLGDNYSLLYQEEEFSQGKEKHDAQNNADKSSTNRPIGKEEHDAQNNPDNSSTKNSEETKEYCNLTLAMHLLFWAVLSNKKELAEIFWNFSKSKIGTALLVCKMFLQFAKTAEFLRERNLKEEMDKNAQHFEGLAKDILDKMYLKDRYKAYRHLGAEVEFTIGKYLTPMSIAYDSGAEDFMSHPCCQTLLKLIWLNTMDLGTRPYHLMPWLFPLNIFFFVNFKNDLWRYALKPPSTVKEDKNEQKKSENTLEKSTTKCASFCDCFKYQEKQRIDNNSSEEAKMFRMENACEFWLSCIQRYFTAPVNKFAHSFVSYMILLVIFTHFVLTDLKPLGPNGVEEVTLYEWLIYIWMVSIICQEIKQMFRKNISGPLYNNSWVNNKVWKWHEWLQIKSRIYWVKAYFYDVWNAMDVLMIVFLGASVGFRFTLDKKDFTVARIFFCVALLLYYWRFLRFGYVVKELGPRIVVIAKLLSDLGFFLVIMMVFIVSFGVAFQSLISPNTEPSWQLLSNVLWRGYWQMLGEIFIDDATEGMGLETTPRNCTTDRELARSHPDVYEHCHEWFLPVLLGLFMMITNILLLNLLIAIFSRSFEDAEAKSMKIWQYHLYDLYREYYSQVWMPPPLNLPWYLVKIVLYFITKLWKCGKKRDTKSETDLPKLSADMFCLNKKYREGVMEEEALKEVLKDRRCDENPKIKELEKMVVESKITSEKILEMIQDLKSMIENQSPAYNRENTVGTQVSESPAQIDHAKTFA